MPHAAGGVLETRDVRRKFDMICLIWYVSAQGEGVPHAAGGVLEILEIRW